MRLIYASAIALLIVSSSGQAIETSEPGPYKFYSWMSPGEKQLAEGVEGFYVGSDEQILVREWLIDPFGRELLLDTRVELSKKGQLSAIAAFRDVETNWWVEFEVLITGTTVEGDPFATAKDFMRVGSLSSATAEIRSDKFNIRKELNDNEIKRFRSIDPEDLLEEDQSFLDSFIPDQTLESIRFLDGVYCKLKSGANQLCDLVWPLILKNHFPEWAKDRQDRSSQTNWSQKKEEGLDTKNADVRRIRSEFPKSLRKPPR